MYLDKSVAVVVPAYKEESQIADVITTMPASSITSSLSTMQVRSQTDLRDCRVASLRASNVDLVARHENGGVGAAIESDTCEHGSTQISPASWQVTVKWIRQIFTASFTRSPPASGLCKGEPSHTRVFVATDPGTRLIGNMLLSFRPVSQPDTDRRGRSDRLHRGVSPLITQFVKRGIYPRYAFERPAHLARCSAGVDACRPRYDV